MTKIVFLTIMIFILASIMSMIGRGGGNFYVPLLVLAGIPFHNATCSSLFILTLAALASALVFHKKKLIDWKLALIIDPPTDIMAFVGGLFAGHFNIIALKLSFAGLLFLASYFMFVPVSEARLEYLRSKKGFGYWHRHRGEYDYTVDLRYTLPITAAVGLFAGMTGISGGSFKVPLMVLFCGVPVKIAIGTSSLMVGVTALMGFSGHFLAGDFNYHLALPVAFAAVIGGLMGGKISIKTAPDLLRKIFGITTSVAGLLMIWSALR